jgi:DNA modification methylase
MAMIPHRSAIALQAAGWWVRNDIVWEKPNSMPSSVVDRCSVSKEYIFLLSKSSKYYFDYKAIEEPSLTREKRPSGVVRNRVFGYDSKLNNNPEVYLHKNLKDKGQPVHTMHKKRVMGEEYSSPVRRKRDVWRVNTKPYKGSHFAVFPPGLITPCILAGSRVGDTVLDPFMGSGTTAMVAEAYGRRWIGIELNPEYCDIAIERISGVQKQDSLFNF